MEVQYLDNITKKNYLCSRSGGGENFELGTSCKLATAGDKLTKEFNIDKYNPKNKKDCTE